MMQDGSDGGGRSPVADQVVRTRALVVEDDPNIVDLIRSNLAVRGFDTVVSADGSRALQLLDTEEPDIVLLDLMLPEADGFELCRLMRERSGVAIIVVSARGGERDKVTALNMGADDYLAKPIVPAMLAEVIDRYLASGEAKDDHAESVSVPSPEQPFDADALLARVEGDRTLVGEMVSLLDGEAPALIAQARTALEGKDFQALHRAAHSLKGAVGNFGNGPAFRAAEKLEACARSGAGADDAEAACHRLESELKRLLASLEPFREEITK